MAGLDDSIFVLGSPRSCTTFLGSCLGELPQISYANEPRLTKWTTAYAMTGVPSDRLVALYYRMAWGGIHRGRKTRFAEKTPRNCMIGDFLSRHFPRSQFIHIVRDVRDVAVSHLRQPWLLSRTDGLPVWNYRRYIYGAHPRFWVETARRSEFSRTTDLHRIVWEWRRYNKAVLALEKTLPESRYLRICMEDMAARPDVTANGILDFLNIADESSCKLFLQALGRAHSRSIGQWQGAFTDEQMQVFTDEAGELMDFFGYGKTAERKNG